VRPTASLFARAGHSTDVSPAFVGGTAYFGARRPPPDDERERFGPPGLRAAGGDESWFFRSEPPLASPTVVGDAVLLTTAGVTRALDRRDGTLCWAYRDGRGLSTASPAVVDDTVYVTGTRVFALAARTGEIRWATDSLRFGPRGTAATADAVFATTGGKGRGSAYRFDPETGRRVWARSTDSPLPVPPVRGELVYVAGADGRLRALEPADGSLVWSRDLGGRSSAMPAVGDRTVYAAATDGSVLYAFDGHTGDERWRFRFEGGRATGPTVAGDTVYLPTSAEAGAGGLVHELATHDGTVRRSHHLPREPVTPLVVGTSSGLIGAGSPASETRLYRLDRPAPE